MKISKLVGVSCKPNHKTSSKNFKEGYIVDVWHDSNLVKVSTYSNGEIWIDATEVLFAWSTDDKSETTHWVPKHIFNILHEHGADLPMPATLINGKACIIYAQWIANKPVELMTASYINPFEKMYLVLFENGNWDTVSLNRDILTINGEP